VSMATKNLDPEAKPISRDGSKAQDGHACKSVKQA